MQSVSYCGLSQSSLYINCTDYRITKAVCVFHEQTQQSKTLQSQPTHFYEKFINRHWWQNGGYKMADKEERYCINLSDQPRGLVVRVSAY